MINRILCVLFGHKHLLLNIQYPPKYIAINNLMSIWKYECSWIDVRLCSRCKVVYWKYVKEGIWN